MRASDIGVTLRHVTFSEELVHFARERAFQLASTVPSIGNVEVVLEARAEKARSGRMFEAWVEARHRGRAVGLRRCEGDPFLAVRNALDALQASLVGASC